MVRSWMGSEARGLEPALNSAEMATPVERLVEERAGAEEYVSAGRQLSAAGQGAHAGEVLLAGCDRVLARSGEEHEDKAKGLLSASAACHSARCAAQTPNREASLQRSRRTAALLSSSAAFNPSGSTPQIARALAGLIRHGPHSTDALRYFDSASHRLFNGLDSIAPSIGFALTRAGQGELHKAVRELERALKRNPSAPSSVRTALGACHLRMGQLSIARMCFERAVQLNRTDADACLGLALVHRASSKPNPDVQFARQQKEWALAAHKADPNHHGPLLLLAEHAAIAGSADEASSLAASAYVRAPSSEAKGEAYLNVARGLHVQGKLNDARRWYITSYKENPHLAASRAGCAQCQLPLNDRRGAVEQLEKALELAPGDPLCTQLLGHCLAGHDDTRAAKLLEQAASSRGGPPKPLECWIELGGLLSSDRPQRALESYEEAIALAEHNSAMQLGLIANAAGLAAHLGDVSKARMWYSQALDKAGLPSASALASKQPSNLPDSVSNELDGVHREANVADDGLRRLLLNLAAFEGTSGNENRQNTILEAVTKTGGDQTASEAALLRSSVAARKGSFEDALRYVQYSKPPGLESSGWSSSSAKRKRQQGEVQGESDGKRRSKEVKSENSDFNKKEEDGVKEEATENAMERNGDKEQHDDHEHHEDEQQQHEQNIATTITPYHHHQQEQKTQSLDEEAQARQADALALEGWIRLQQGEWKRAEESFNALRVCSSKSEEYALVGLGITAYQQSIKPGPASRGRNSEPNTWPKEKQALDRASSYFRRALKCSKTNVCAAQGAGAVLCELGRPADALECLSEVEAALTAQVGGDTTKQLGEARVNLAHAHLAKASTQQELRRAAALYETASARVFKNRDARVMQFRARAEHDAGMHAEAKRSCLQALHLAPESVQMRQNSAMTLQDHAVAVLKSIHGQPGSHLKELEGALREIEKSKAVFQQLKELGSDPSIGLQHNETEDMIKFLERTKSQKFQTTLEHARQQASDREKVRREQENVMRSSEQLRKEQEETKRRQEKRRREVQAERAEQDRQKLLQKHQKWREQEQAAQERKEAKKRKADSKAGTTAADEETEEDGNRGAGSGPRKKEEEEVLDVPLPDESEAGERSKALQQQLGLAEDGPAEGEDEERPEVRDAMGWRNREEEKRRSALERLQEEKAKRQKTT